MANLEYEGFVGRVEFDSEADIFHGEVINTRDVITFQGRSVKELRKAFVDSIEDYREFCAERGEKPDRPFSGTFSVRISPELHHDVYVAAKAQGKTMNGWVAELLTAASATMIIGEAPVAVVARESGPFQGTISRPRRQAQSGNK